MLESVRCCSWLTGELLLILQAKAGCSACNDLNKMQNYEEDFFNSCLVIGLGF